MKRTLRCLVTIGVLALGCCLRLQAHESPVDPVSRTLTFWAEGDRLRVRYEEQVSERSALLELYAMDRNRDGVIQDGERDAFMGDKAKKLAGLLTVRIAGAPLDLAPVGPVVLRRGWRRIFEFEASLAAIAAGTHRIELSDMNSRFRPGPFQWTVGRPADLGAKGASPGRAVTLRGVPPGGVGSMRGEADRVGLEAVLMPAGPGN